MFNKKDFSRFEIYTNNIVLNGSGFFLELFEVSSGSPKIHNMGFGAQGHLQKSRNHRNEGFEGSHNQFEKL